MIDGDGRLQIPIHLPSDVDRDAVFAAVEDELTRIHGLLVACTPPEPGHARGAEGLVAEVEDA